MAFGRKAFRKPDNTPSLSSLSGPEREFIDNQLQVARLVVARYLGRADSPPSLSQMALTVRDWYDDDPGDRLINDLVNALGMAFGHHPDLKLEWVIATDEAGSDLALHRQQGDVLIYPANTLAKRIVKGEWDFSENLAEEFVRSIRSIEDTR